MADATEQYSIAAGSAQRILRLLEALRQNEAGGVIYQQVEHMLTELVTSQSTIEHIYAGITTSLLDACARDLAPGSSALVHVRLLQARIQPPLDAPALLALQDYAETQAASLLQRKSLDAAVLEEAVHPLLVAFGIVPDSPVSKSTSVAHDEIEAGEPSHATIKREVVIPSDLHLNGDQLEAEHGMMQNHIRDLQAGLASQVLDTISQNQEFGVLLEVVHHELRAADSQQLEDLRSTLVREIERLRIGHKDLASKLDQTHQHLQVLETDSRQLSDELTRVRLLSLTDELTGLSNRRAFLRRLEDEVARVQRYGFPLSIALIDLDHFKEVNDLYGHAAGDEVLRVYAKNILSIFRHHDLVARYGGEEFAVLLPNTDLEGSSRALYKVKHRCNEASWDLNDQEHRMPTFSAGLALYKPGETSSTFIERVDKALYRAKRLGRNRIEIDQSYTLGSISGRAESDKE